MNVSRIARGFRRRVRDASLDLLRSRPEQAGWILTAARLVLPRSLRRRIYRSLSWPLAGALEMRLEIDAAGGRMNVDTADTVGRVIAVSGVWEPHVTALVGVLVSPADVVVDVGAHIGYYTLLAARLVGERGHVYAVEPSRARCAELHANLVRNDMKHVTVLELAAGSQDGVATLYEAPRTNTSASTVLPDPVGVGAATTEYSPTRVPVTRVDTCIPAGHVERVRLVKIDVEGFEVEVLNGLDRVLDAGKPLCLVVEISPEWSPSSPAFLERLCDKQGFVPYRISNTYTLDGYFPRQLVPPSRVASIPDVRADLVLVRGTELSRLLADYDARSR